jgi:type I restriction enzyme S subunit
MPNTWPLVQLGEMLTKSDDWITIKPDEKYRQVTVKLWGQGVVLRNEVTGAEIAARERVRVRGQQFILSRIDARNGALGLVPDFLDGGVVSSDFPVFTPNHERILSQFLNWMSKTAGFVDLCKAASEGTTNRVRLKEDKFLAFKIPLPPLDEQRRIVTRIEQLAAKVQEARHLRQEATDETASILSSQTTEMFDKLSKCYPKKPIRTMGPLGENPVQTGPFGAQLHSSDFVAEGVPVLNVGNVWPQGLNFDRLDHILAEKAAQLSRYSLRTGDLLFARSGATLGKVCLVPAKCDGWLMTGHLFRVRLAESLVSNRFAFAALRGARSIHEQVFRQVRGATRPGYNTTLLGNVELPLPSLAEQRRIVAELDDLQAKVDALKELQAETATELDALLPSVLDMAFKGEL